MVNMTHVLEVYFVISASWIAEFKPILVLRVSVNDMICVAKKAFAMALRPLHRGCSPTKHLFLHTKGL
jgi:hypothetical protein